MRPAAAILGLGTALPAHPVRQDEAARAFQRALPEGTPRRAVIPRLFGLSGVDSRHASVPDFGPRGPGPLLRRPPPGTAHRMGLYREHAPPLAAAAARRALESAGRAAVDVTHLVVVSCTGFYAPGPDVDLVFRLGLRPDVERTLVGFMGCHGAFNGLRVARQAVASPDALALVVCVELCSIHFRPDTSRDNLVACSLFADGAAAAVVGQEPRPGESLALLGRAATRIEPDSTSHMGWEIGDQGFLMTLSSYVPALLAADLAPFVRTLAPEPVDAWCVHPGGPAILAHVEDAVGLPRGGLATSRAVLRDVGNLSSATVLFVLARELPRLAAGARGLMLGFGPGLTLEGLSFVRGAALLRPECVATASGSPGAV